MSEGCLLHLYQFVAVGRNSDLVSDVDSNDSLSGFAASVQAVSSQLLYRIYQDFALYRGSSLSLRAGETMLAARQSELHLIALTALGKSLQRRWTVHNIPDTQATCLQKVIRLLYKALPVSKS